MPDEAASKSAPSADSAAAAATVAAAPPCFVRAHREAKTVWVFGVRMRFLIDSADTGGRYSMVETYVPALDPGPPPHVHDDCEEMFHVLAGALRVTVAGQTLTARSGDTLIVPRGVLHTFSNPFLTPCRALVQVTPGGFEQFFHEIGVPVTDASEMLAPPPSVPTREGPSPAMDRLRALAIKHHMRIPGLTE